MRKTVTPRTRPPGASEVARRAPTASPEFLDDGGELGELIRTKDWAQTPLGPVSDWPQSLRTIVRIMLTSSQPIWIGWGPDLTYLYNDPYKTIIGDKHPHALGQPTAVVWKEIWSDIQPMLKQVMEQNRGTYVESQLLIMERYGYPEETYYTFSYNPVPSEQGGVGGMICTNTDDTQRVIGERQTTLLRELAAATSDIRTIEEVCWLSAGALGTNAKDFPFAMIYLHDAATQTVQLAGAAGLKKRSSIAPKTISLTAPCAWPIADVLNTGKTAVISDLQQFEQIPTGDWKTPPYQAAVAHIPASGEDGHDGVLIVGLSPYRLFDEAYQRTVQLVAEQIAASIRVARAYEEERRRAEALAELDRAKTIFFSNVSHEFRTPLTLMLGPIEETLNNPSELPETRERMSVAHRNALRLLKLVNALLDFSRIEAGRVQAVYEPTDLAAATIDLASGFRSAIEQAGMQLIVDVSPLQEPVYVDRAMWEQIVLNLLSNAFKFTLAGKITIALHQKGRMAALSVTDTGVGIPKSELPRLFERFHRVEGTEGRTHEGTGIGLSLVQELVKLHGGTIEVRSTVGKGTTFTVALPLGTAHLPKERISAERLPAPAAVGSSAYVTEAARWLPDETGDAALLPDLDVDFTLAAQAEPDATPGERKARVLLAEDNADMRAYIQALLSRTYEVTAVRDGREALQAATRMKPDLVLTDVMMPHLDGFELLRALRANPETATLPIILLSARAGEEARIEGVAAGAVDYLVKPFSARELLARVGAHLEMAAIRKQAQAATEAERQRLFELFMQAPSYIAVLRGPRHVFELANPLYLRLIGKTDSIIGKPLKEVLPEIEEQGFIDLLDGVYRSGEPFVGTETPVLLDRQGTGQLDEIFVNFVYLPYKDTEGVTQGVLVHAVDVTTQVVARKRVEELGQQKDEFLGIASHELKTPVTSIKAYTQVLRRQFARAGNEKAALQLGKMDAQLDRLTDLIRDLLDVTKIDAGKLQLRQEDFDFDSLVNEVVEHLQLTTSQHTIEVEGSTATVHGDRDRLGQVLTNLVSNAIKYSPSADKIIVRLDATQDLVTVCVQDFGIGIPEEMRPRVFERFYRVVGDGRETYPGLGLGLYISSEIIKRHGGSIRLESDQQPGTTFCFSIPRERSDQQELGEEQRA